MNDPHDSDTTLLRALREATDPGPRPEARRAVFVDETAERAVLGARRRSSRWLALGAVASGAAALMLVVLGGIGSADPPEAGPSLASYAYYETDLLAGEGGTDLVTWMSEDQAALATAFDLP
jgi:hypothetical protein